MSHRSMDLQPGHKSLSHSRRSTFRRCRRLYWYQYQAGIQTKEMPAPFRMGGIYSDGLEAGNSEIVRVKYNDVIAEALHDGNHHLAETCLDELAVVVPMVDTYLDHIGLDNVEREVEFTGPSHAGYQDNGRMDGVVQPTHQELLTIVENKLKSRWGRAEADALALDDQLTGYFFNASVVFSKPVDQLQARYEVAKKPALRQRQGETREAYRLRVSADIRSRPDFYHWVSDPITRSQEQMDEWLILFRRMAEDIRHEENLEGLGDPGAWPKNPDSCSDYGGCSYARICWARNEDDAVRVIQTEFNTGDTNG